MKLWHDKAECCISWFTAIISKRAKESDCHSIVLTLCASLANRSLLVVDRLIGLEVQKCVCREAFGSNSILQCESNQNIAKITKHVDGSWFEVKLVYAARASNCM